MNLMKKIFILIFIFMNLILIEIGCYFLIKPAQSKYNNIHRFRDQSENIKRGVINEEYYSTIPYLRDQNQYSGETYIRLKSDKDYFFNELNQFFNQNICRMKLKCLNNCQNFSFISSRLRL